MDIVSNFITYISKALFLEWKKMLLGKTWTSLIIVASILPKINI